MRTEIVTRSEEQTIALGRALGRLLHAGDVVALHGELGAGKTRLVRGIAGGMGLDERLVSSPTFVMVNEYEGAGRMPLVHADAYRLSGADDLDTLGWDRLMDGEAVVVVEWAERIAAALPLARDRLDVALAPGRTENERHIAISGDDAWTKRRGWGAVVSGPRIADATVDPAALPEGWVRCPISGKPVPPDSPTFPFFDEKCRMADLGRWFGGSYTVSRELSHEDLDDRDIEPHG